MPRNNTSTRTWKLADLPPAWRLQAEAQLGIQAPPPEKHKTKVPRALQPMKGELPAALQPGKNNVSPASTYLWLPGYRVASLNRILYKSRFVAMEEKKLAAAAIEKALFGYVPVMQNHKVMLTITLYRTRLIDMDNAFVKPCIDQLRYKQLLMEDNPDAMELSVKQIKVAKKDLEGTAILIVKF